MKRTKIRPYPRSTFRSLPLGVARKTSFCLYPFRVNSLDALCDLLLSFPLPYVSVALVAAGDTCDLGAVESVLAAKDCPILDISLHCDEKSWNVNLLRLLLRSNCVEALGLQYFNMGIGDAHMLLSSLEDSASKAHTLHLKFPVAPAVTTTQFVSELIAKDGSLLNLDVSNSGIDLSFGSLQSCSFLESLETTKSLCYLRLRGVGLDERGVILLSKTLSVQRSIELLDISENHIGDKAVCALAECLRTQRTLRFLGICEAAVSEIGGCALAKALEENETLDLLFMKDDDLGVASGRAFASMLKINTTLRRLYLNYCSLGREGCKAFTEALSVNRTLKHLRLNYNGVGGEDLAAMIDLAKRGQVLEVLEVEDRNELTETRVLSKNTLYLYSFDTNYARHCRFHGRHDKTFR